MRFEGKIAVIDCGFLLKSVYIIPFCLFGKGWGPLCAGLSLCSFCFIIPFCPFEEAAQLGKKRVARFGETRVRFFLNRIPLFFNKCLKSVSTAQTEKCVREASFLLETFLWGSYFKKKSLRHSKNPTLVSDFEEVYDKYRVS